MLRARLQISSCSSAILRSLWTACVKAVASPGVPATSGPSPTTPTAPPQQTVTLPPMQAGPIPTPIAVTLSTITPSAALPPSDQKLCPTAAGQTHCSGKISSVVADFSKFNEPVTIAVPPANDTVDVSSLGG